ncbi:MAG: type II secretion system F family protein [Chloroflexota bacterium]|nr:type II secretion system F family protein [Chloroflexota bacterium]
MNGLPTITALAAGSSATILVYTVLAQVADIVGGARHRRVVRLTKAGSDATSPAPAGSLGAIVMLLEALGRRLGRSQGLVRVQDLRDAGFEAAWVTPRTIVAIKLVIGASIGGALALLIPWLPAMTVGAPIGGLLGFAAPSLVIDARRAARRKQILTEVPDVIAELRGLIGTGMGVERALHVLVEDDASEVASTALIREMRRSIAAYGLGVPLTVALQEAADRLGSPEFEAFVLALKQARRLGSELDAVLDQHEVGLRAQRQNAIDAEVASQEAKAQLVIAVCFLPAFMLLIFVPMLVSIAEGLFG